MADSSEIARIIRGLQFVGWTNDQINTLILFIEEGGDIAEKLTPLKESLQKLQPIE